MVTWTCQLPFGGSTVRVLNDYGREHGVHGLTSGIAQAADGGARDECSKGYESVLVSNVLRKSSSGDKCAVSPSENIVAVCRCVAVTKRRLRVRLLAVNNSAMSNSFD